jgi:hypothetical protein
MSPSRTGALILLPVFTKQIDISDSITETGQEGYGSKSR